jgi:hypothetical protein
MVCFRYIIANTLQKMITDDDGDNNNNNNDDRGTRVKRNNEY